MHQLSIISISYLGFHGVLRGLNHSWLGHFQNSPGSSLACSPNRWNRSLWGSGSVWHHRFIFGGWTVSSKSCQLSTLTHSPWAWHIGFMSWVLSSCYFLWLAISKGSILHRSNRHLATVVKKVSWCVLLLLWLLWCVLLWCGVVVCYC